MSVHELNQLMTYVVEGWMLFSAGFISTTFIAFVSRRIAEDMEAAGLTLEEIEAAAIAQPSKGIALSESQTLAQSDEVIAQAAAAETIRLEEVAVVSEKLAKEKEKQSGSSVSVST
jgi:hypothetical protein